MSVYARLNNGNTWHRVTACGVDWVSLCNRVLPAGETRVSIHGPPDCKDCIRALQRTIRGAREAMAVVRGTEEG